MHPVDLRRVLRAAWLVAPPSCAACRAPPGGELVCGACLRRLPWLRGHRCPRCALPRHRAGCPAAAAAFDRAWAPLAYEGPARDLVARAEVPRRAARRGPDGRAHGRQPAARPAHRAARLASGVLAHGVAVVPVPAHRGPPPAAGLRPRGRCSPPGSPQRAGLPLSRLPAGARTAARRQVGAGRRAAPQRRALRRGRHRRRRRARALLVDDVHTTGATLDVCARALKADGREWVGAVTYVRTL